MPSFSPSPSVSELLAWVLNPSLPTITSSPSSRPSLSVSKAHGLVVYASPPPSGHCRVPPPPVASNWSSNPSPSVSGLEALEPESHKEEYSTKSDNPSESVSGSPGSETTRVISTPRLTTNISQPNTSIPSIRPSLSVSGSIGSVDLPIMRLGSPFSSNGSLFLNFASYSSSLVNLSLSSTTTNHTVFLDVITWSSVTYIWYIVPEEGALMLTVSVCPPAIVYSPITTVSPTATVSPIAYLTVLTLVLNINSS